MVSIFSKWHDLGGGKYLFLRPEAEVSGENWVKVLGDELDGFEGDTFKAAVDLLSVFDDTNFDGFKSIIDLLISRNITKYRLVLLSTDEKMDLLVTLFKSIAEAKEFDLDVKIATDQKGAESWLETV